MHIGKFHEISFYGLCASIICLIIGKASISSLVFCGFHPLQYGFVSIFQCFLFWTTVLFIPIAIIGSFSTKYEDDGEGLSFTSDNHFVIIFAHIAEEILGLILSPFWFLKDLFTHQLYGEKLFDYITQFILILFILVGIIVS